MAKTLSELINEIDTSITKIGENAKVNEQQEKDLKDLKTNLSNILKNLEKNEEVDKGQAEIDDMLFQEIYKLIQKTDSLAESGVKLSKVQKLEASLDKAVQAIKEKFAAERELSDQVDTLQGEKIQDNKEDIDQLYRDQTELAKVVRSLETAYVNEQIAKAEAKSAKAIFLRGLKTLGKEVLRFVLYFIIFKLITA